MRETAQETSITKLHLQFLSMKEIACAKDFSDREVIYICCLCSDFIERATRDKSVLFA